MADVTGQRYRSYSNEKWEFDQQGLMKQRHACINDLAFEESERKFHWPQGTRPAEHASLTELGL